MVILIYHKAACSGKPERQVFDMKICKENYVSQLRLHNGKALEFFIMEQGERLISIIRKHLFTLPHLQQECLLDTVRAIWTHIDSFHYKNEFGSWIGTVARYRCLEFLKTHQNEATIAWLIEKEIAEEQEMMVSCLNPKEQELFYRFYVGESFGSANQKDADIVYHNMYDLLNRIDTDIFEYEKEHLTLEEKEELCRQLQSLLKEKKRRFPLKKYFGAYFQKAAFLNC